MKVADLTGARLALWTARADGHADAFLWTERSGYVVACKNAADTEGFMPHEDWRHGGPLLDQFEVMFGRSRASSYQTHEGLQGKPIPGTLIDRRYATARVFGTEGTYEGDTMLIAGMRAIVASVYGSEVPDSALTDPAAPRDPPG